MRSSTISGGKSDKNARSEDDFYATPKECTAALLEYLPAEYFGSTIWQPDCGEGDMSRVLSDAGHYMISTDLVNRGYGIGGVDFLKTGLIAGATSIVSNPPFDKAEEFIRHARSMDVPFAMITKSTYWHAGKRKELFYDTGPATVLAMLWRPAMKPSRGKSPTMEFIWTIWGAEPFSLCTYDLAQKP